MYAADILLSPLNSNKSMPENSDCLQDALDRLGASFDISFEPLRIDETMLRVININNMRPYLDRLIARGAIQQPLRDLPLWAKVWPGSLILGRFLRKFSLENKNVLELGCGMGVMSLIAAQYGPARITATDIEPMALDCARANIIANNLSETVSARYLDVAKPDLPKDIKYDVIAASELLYLDELHRPLLRFLKGHLAPGGKAFFCTDILRQKPRFQKLAARIFQLQEGKIGIKSGDSERHIYSILILQ